MTTTDETTTGTPAETMRRAAKLMRERAGEATPGPWERPLDVRQRSFVGAALPDDEYPTPTGHESGVIQDYETGYKGRYIGQRERCEVVSAPTWSDGRFYRGSFRPPGATKKLPSRSGRDLDYIASMHPGVALVLADLLDEIARQYDAPPCDSPAGVCNGCERREDFNDAERLAWAYLGETAAAATGETA